MIRQHQFLVVTTAVVFFDDDLPLPVLTQASSPRYAGQALHLRGADATYERNEIEPENDINIYLTV